MYTYKWIDMVLMSLNPSPLELGLQRTLHKIIQSKLLFGIYYTQISKKKVECWYDIVFYEYNIE